MKKIILLLFLVSFFYSNAQTTEQDDIEAIKTVLKKQRLAWSNDNIEEFMEGYWNNDSLKFYGNNGITYGWENTLERYKKAYPSEDHTGILSFKINAVTKIADDAYYVLGEYHLKRNVGNADGIFMLIFKKIEGEWKIIVDTSS